MQSNDGAAEAELELLNTTIPPMDPATAKLVLSDAKRILDGLGVAFFLRQGTALGAVRDHAFIPWDDDIDLGIVMGLHGFGEDSVQPVIDAFREAGYYTSLERTASYVYTALMKHHTKIDMYFLRVVNGQVYHYPGLWFPIRFFTGLAEIGFLGATYRVPNPPEEYLLFKYGPNWRIPKRAGYEKDVLDNMRYAALPVRRSALRHFLTRRLMPWHAVRLRVLDDAGRPVQGAQVSVVGVGRTTTDKTGFAKLYPPGDAVYAMTITFGGCEEVLYEERIAPGKTYVYRPDPMVDAGRIFILSRA